MEVRPVRDLAEFRGAYRVNVDAWRAAYDGIVADAVLDGLAVPDRDALADRFRAARADGWFLVAVADADPHPDPDAPSEGAGDADRVVGFADVIREDTKGFVGDDDAELRALYVDPDRWGKGIGTALLEAVVDRLDGDEDRPHRLVLETFADNGLGRTFYRRRGFERVGESEFEVGDETHPTVVYAMPL